MISFDDLVKEMLKCEQTKGQTVYQHGVDVWNCFSELTEIVHRNWRLPSWFYDYGEGLIENIHENHVISNYIRLHDIGKPHCRTVDENGKVHFPNHAEVSKNIFLESDDVYNTQEQLKSDGRKIANLIGWDMILHTASAEEIQNYIENIWTIQDACTLLLAALAEVHSNAKLFGGTDSNSFKAKWKQLDRRGKQICNFYFEQEKKNG
ncbi:MAG: hypothetical protein DWQ19_09540 [Crenarchaeota archaeon]|nr:MAG: hypothetical protein DWQ19_09540 [Thermoproteota archaeon]